MRFVSIGEACWWAALVLASGVAVHAHHSPVEFDRDREVEIRGVVTKLLWINPHVQIEVKSDDGVWIVESQSPRVMGLFGWSRDSLVIGESVTVIANPLREASERRTLGLWVEKENGTRLEIAWDPEVVREAIRSEA